MLSDKNIVVDAQGKVIGRLFEDGYVYNKKGISIDKISYNGNTFYSGKIGKILPKGNVVDFYGNYIGFVNNSKIADK